MSDFLRLLLLLVLAGCAVTAAASATAWWLEEQRRLSRIIQRVLGGPPDAQIIARGRNTAAAIKLDTDQAVVMWRGGANALLYPLTALLGAELIIDNVVAARVYHGEQRLPLEEIDPEAGQVTLRLMFDNPRDPDFELTLWDARDKNPGVSAAAAAQEGRTWLARAEAILRRPAAAPPVAARPEPGFHDDPAFDEDPDDEPPF